MWHIPWMELNQFAVGHAHFRKSQKLENLLFSNSSLEFCPICVKLGTYTLQLDLILSYQKNFAWSTNVQIINEHISGAIKNVNCLISRSN